MSQLSSQFASRPQRRQSHERIRNERTRADRRFIELLQPEHFQPFRWDSFRPDRGVRRLKNDLREQKSSGDERRKRHRLCRP
jgi:hypothetical protein